MNQAQFLRPMVAMMLLTLAIWVILFARRPPAMQKLRHENFSPSVCCNSARHCIVNRVLPRALCYLASLLLLWLILLRVAAQVFVAA